MSRVLCSLVMCYFVLCSAVLCSIVLPGTAVTEVLTDPSLISVKTEPAEDLDEEVE